MASQKNINWTKAQLSAIQKRNKTLLVSAAAGSGKTAVLIERIIKRLTDEDSPIDITRLLVVTYTKAAASELRERISASLSAALRASPSNRHLAGQLIKLTKAKICTIHSFCNDIIRSNFSLLGLNANVRIADDAEMKLINKNVMNSVIDNYYNNDTEQIPIADFGAFVDNFVTDRDDKLPDVLIALYKKLHSYPEGIDFISVCADDLENASELGFFDTKWGKTINTAVLRQLEYYNEMLSRAIDYIESDELFTKNYEASFRYDLKYIHELITLLHANNYNSIKTLLNEYGSITLGRGVKKDSQTHEMEFYKSVRTDFAKQRKKIAETYFSLTDSEISVIEKATSGVCRNIFTILNEYEKRLNSEKRKRSVLDYSDLEHYTMNLFYDREGNRTDTAIATCERFDEIYIDEYQDINAIQDRIFTAISRKNNQFLVGDIKQSIYGFRGAVPDIFSHYRDMFKKENADSETLFLSENFRSDSSVIEFTNLICGCLFTHNSLKVPYYNEDNLICAKNEDKTPHKVQISIVNSESDAEDETDSPTNNNEAVYVVNEIRKLLNEGYRAGDITLLFRSIKNSSQVYESELSKLNISYYTNTSRGFFENPGILLMMCLLNCIDNPSRDIYLAGALKSPLFGVTLDELVNIRLHNSEGSLYDSLKSYIMDTGFTKGKFFFEKLEIYRKYAEAQPVDKLIWFLYRDTGIMSFVYSDDSCRANLMLLYEYARKFEQGSFKGLYNFILYVNDIIDERETLQNAKIFTDKADTVKIMTIHQSKGLEFPVCFLCDTSRKFNTGDIKDSLITEHNLGLALKLRDETGFARFDTPIRQAVALQITENNIDEEIRILYVALTRAKERLYITASSKSPDKLLGDSVSYMSPYTLMRDNCYIKWILNAIALNNSKNIYDINVIQNPVAQEILSGEIEIIPLEPDEMSYGDCSRIIHEHLLYTYPWQKLASLPAKLTVSELYPGVLDDDKPIDDKPLKILEKPRFMMSDSSVASASERGTATHVFMQFCDFSFIEKYGVNEELERLVAHNFMTKSNSSLVYISLIERFMKSSLYTQMKAAKKLWREVRFNIKLPASEFTVDKDFSGLLNDEQILVQGVIDCFFETQDGKLILIDYKTDYISNDERSNPKLAAKKLLERHSRQLSYYKSACTYLMHRNVDKLYIYSFGLGECIEVTEEANEVRLS